ncbi:Fe-only nitrogenase subunit delta [Acerihabitans arboris]|uniref:Nitrogenase iron-iron protein delta chain n=1 Tax=Acerihabitans arboris TaxID=2691583 RepID=A0A845SUF9_9GAMM|nr:Fe-only nitrogenase subunit delta [Acerihabitans arboris]NDL64645.1 Fe-only nitrogenase subunit delta [Acerihabitans arboris]
MANEIEDRIEPLIDYIMKNCLWQFHSRVWDREKQNAGILRIVAQLLCDDPVDLGTPANRCYWADAVVLVDAYKLHFPWLGLMDKGDIKQLITALHERLNYLTITGSLNAELTDQRY